MNPNQHSIRLLDSPQQTHPSDIAQRVEIIRDLGDGGSDDGAVLDRVNTFCISRPRCFTSATRKAQRYRETIDGSAISIEG